MLQQRPALRHPILWLIPALIWCAWLVYASLVKVPDNIDFLPSDKLMHVTAYAVLVFLFGCVLKPTSYIWLLVLAASLGMLLEYFQSLTPYRSFEWADGLANMVGAALGLLLVATPVGRVYERIESLHYD